MRNGHSVCAIFRSRTLSSTASLPSHRSIISEMAGITHIRCGEIARILKPGGKLVLLYEPSSPAPLYARARRRVNRNREHDGVDEDVLVVSKLRKIADELVSAGGHAIPDLSVSELGRLDGLLLPAGQAPNQQNDGLHR